MLQRLLTLFVEFVALSVKAVILFMAMAVADTIYMGWTTPSMGVWWILFFGASWVVFCLLWGFGRLRRCWVPALSAIPLCAAGEHALQVHDWLLVAVWSCQFAVLLNDLTHPDSAFAKAVEGCTGGNSPPGGRSFQGNNPAE